QTLYPCKLEEVKSDLGEIADEILFGGNPIMGWPRSESIYFVRILFQGKLEGEMIYKAAFHKAVIYANPEKKFVRYIDFNRETSTSKISRELLDAATNWDHLTKSPEWTDRGRSHAVKA